jgi:hypothetical protein
MNDTIQREAEQDALGLAGDVIFGRWAEVRRRLDASSPAYAAAVTVMALDHLTGSAYDRSVEIYHFKQFLLEAR